MNYNKNSVNLYNEIASQSRNGIGKIIGFNEDNLQKFNLSIWHYSESDSTIYQIGGTEKDAKKCFPINMTSIIGCAISHPTKTVFWSEDLVEGDTVVYSITNKPEGYYTKDGKINVNNSQFCDYANINHLPYKQVGCFSYKEGANCAVCMDSKIEEIDLNSEQSRMEMIKLAKQIAELKKKEKVLLGFSQIECE